MDIAITIAQVLLGISFIAAGLNHVLNYASASQRPQMAWMVAIGPARMHLIGGLEVLGGIGVLVPWLTGIQPWVSVVAAGCLALLMGAAVIFHAGRRERSAIVVNAVLGLLAVFVVYGRLVIEPI